MKSKLIPAIILITLTTACKKNYTCECVDSVNAIVVSTSNNTIKDTKKKAESTCKAQNTTISVFGINTTRSCSIK